MDEKFSENDPALTAYALGELEGAELAAVEARLQGDAAAQAAVAEIRALEARMKSALSHEASLENAGGAAVAVQRKAKQESNSSYAKHFPRRRWGKLLEFPQLYFVATAVAAACFLIVFFQPRAERRQEFARARQYQEIDLTTLGNGPTAAAPQSPVSEAASNLMELQPFTIPKEQAPAEKDATMGGNNLKVTSDQKAVRTRAIAGGPVRRDALAEGKRERASEGRRLAAADFGASLYAQQAPQSGAWMGGGATTGSALDLRAKKSEDADKAAAAPAVLGDAITLGLPGEHAFLAAKNFPAAKISWQVDAESWKGVQAALEAGRKPMADSVRIEELLQEFAAKEKTPRSQQTFSAKLEVAAAPWEKSHWLVRAELQAGSADLGANSTGAVADKTAAPAVAARDVAVAVEFNPAAVASYRLIGFENATPGTSGVPRESLSALEVKPGELVTALFEIVPVAQLPVAGSADTKTDPLLVVKINYRDAARGEMREQEFSLRSAEGDFAHASPDFKFAAAVAGFGMILRNSPYRGTATFQDVITWAHEGLGEDDEAHRSVLVDLAKKAEDLGQ